MEGGLGIMDMGAEIRVIEVDTEPRWIGPVEPVVEPRVPLLEEVEVE